MNWFDGLNCVLLLVGLGVIGWCFKVMFFPGIPSYMKPFLPTETRQVIKVGNTSRFHRHSFEVVLLNEKQKEQYGPTSDYDEIPSGPINPLSPPRMRDRWICRCIKKGCGAEVLVVQTSMM